eukprot:7855346-Heterocapsa_arctica.AAC.1
MDSAADVGGFSNGTEVTQGVVTDILQKCRRSQRNVKGTTARQSGRGQQRRRSPEGRTHLTPPLPGRSVSDCEIRNNYTAYKTYSGEDCSPHEVSDSEAS